MLWAALQLHDPMTWRASKKEVPHWGRLRSEEEKEEDPTDKAAHKYLYLPADFVLCEIESSSGPEWKLNI